MVNSIRSHFAHNIVGYVALIVALGGTAYAANDITSADIKDGTIQSRDLKDGAVESEDIDNGTIQSRDVRRRAIRRTNLGVSIPSFSVSSGGPPEYATQDTFDAFLSLGLAGSSHYVVLATFSVATAIPFDCSLDVMAGPTTIAGQAIHVVSSGSQTILVDVTPPTGAVAVLGCADGSSQNATLSNPKIAAIRVT